MDGERAERRLHYGWVIIGAIFTMSFFALGARFSFAAFYDSLLDEFGWSRSALAGAAALNLILSGLARPLLGVCVDRFGSKAVMLAGVSAAAAALALLSLANQLWHFYVLMAVLSLGYGAASPSTTVPLVSRWFSRRRATAQSVAGAGGPMGELLIVPIVTAILLFADWHTAYRLLSVFMVVLVLPIVIALIRDDPKDLGLRPFGAATGAGAALAEMRERTETTLRQAVRMPMFWQLSFGFFVCGFTMAFTQTHYMAFADDMAIEKVTASLAMGLVGGVSIIGTIGIGYLGDRYSLKSMLAFTYLIRGLGNLVLWQTHHADLLFLGSFFLGLSWGSTVPLTSACVSNVCGRKALGTIFGVMFAVMPIGSGLGAILAGLVFDTIGSYGPALLVNGVLGFSAAAIIYRMRTPVDAPVAAPAEPAASKQ